MTGADFVYHRTLLPSLADGSARCLQNCHARAVKDWDEPFGTELDSPTKHGNRLDNYLSPKFTGGQPEKKKYPRYDSWQRWFNVMRIDIDTYTPDVAVEKKDQRFEDYATKWEMSRSVLCKFGTEGFMPVVDSNLLVIGHYGIVQGEALVAPKNRATPADRQKLDRLAAALAVGPVFVKLAHEAPVEGWEEVDVPDANYAVKVAMDGEVIVGEFIGERGAEPESFNIDDIYMIVQVFIAVVGAVGKTLVKALIRRATKRKLYQGATKELASQFAKREGQPLVRSLRLTKGYDKRMGIPEEHLKGMVDAARETKSIAVFRANKEAAIPLIRKGAHGKPPFFKFKSSKTTGVLMATTAPDIAKVAEKEYFLVEADGVARRTVNRGGKMVKEQKNLDKAFWKVEPGQVLAPDGMPVVGDYDLLGVLPLESPGRNIVVVPDNVEAGDWIGPDVQKYADSVNRKFDEARVLHGAQDGFHNAEYGGLTDDTAYAVFPDGSTYVMEGKQAQAGFYKAFDRETAVGSYPRPSPANAPADEVAKMRAKKLGR